MLKLKMANTFKATRPRHLLGNDPRKLVSHYEATPVTLIGKVWQWLSSPF